MVMFLGNEKQLKTPDFFAKRIFGQYGAKKSVSM